MPYTEQATQQMLAKLINKTQGIIKEVLLLRVRTLEGSSENIRLPEFAYFSHGPRIKDL